MPASAPSFAQMRRSMLGVWLAVAYALAVMAGGLAPQAAWAHDLMPGATLCSGLVAPGPDAPDPQPELIHCKGCPVNPAVDVPPVADHQRAAPRMRAVALAVPLQRGVILAPACGLPQSRAPPHA